jgi:hypothetical protein
MRNLRKSMAVLRIVLLCGSAALVLGSSGASGENQEGLRKVALSLEKTLPALVSAKDYRSASNTAFLLATARSRLNQTTAACAALSQSLEYYRKAMATETGLPEERGANVDDDSSGMVEVRAKFGCKRI